MKAAPLLRAWLARLRAAGVTFHMRHRWLGWDEKGQLRFVSPSGDVFVPPQPTVLALGGGSWPRLGSTGSWTSILAEQGVPIAPLQPANCGFSVQWSDHFRGRFAGEPLKSVVAKLYPSDPTAAAPTFNQKGEFVITEYGVEGSLIYAASAVLRRTFAAKGAATLYLDLAPNRSVNQLQARLARPRGSNSLANHWRRQINLSGVKAGLLREFAKTADLTDPTGLATRIKSLPLPLGAPRPLAEAISTAGGVSFDAVDDHLQLQALPGVFCAGEMLDWEAPTGGYLLTACLATGRAAGLGVLRILERIKAVPKT